VFLPPAPGPPPLPDEPGDLAEPRVRRRDQHLERGQHVGTALADARLGPDGVALGVHGLLEHRAPAGRADAGRHVLGRQVGQTAHAFIKLFFNFLKFRFQFFNFLPHFFHPFNGLFIRLGFGKFVALGLEFVNLGYQAAPLFVQF